MADNPIVAVEVQETQYGEKVVLQSPFDAKDFIKALPFNEYGSYDDYTAELVGSDISETIIDAVYDYGFSDDFVTHRSWDGSALGPETGAWMVDADTWDESKEFLEFCGFEVEDETNL